MKTLIRLTLAIMLFVSLILSAAAQTIDTAILGTITDSSGAVVPGATFVGDRCRQGGVNECGG